MKCNLRRWKANNPERMPAYHKNEYATKKEQVLARLKRWRDKHAEQWKSIKLADSHNRRTAGDMKPETLIAIWESWNGECFYCKRYRAFPYEVDHFIPIGLGGTHDLSNLRIACSSCNRKKWKHHPEEFLKTVVVYKSSLIDSKTRWGNEAEGVSHRERLSEKTQKWDAIVRSSAIHETEEVSRNV